MKTILTIDGAGRAVLPKPVRDELQIEPGDSLEVESFEDQIILRPVRGSVPLRKKQGVWVFHGEEPLSAAAVDKTLRKVRAERDNQILGKKR
jgi:AbrB family looped-hinge helix DNA binding protein